MGHALVRAILDRALQTPWGSFTVRSPRVGEALVLVAAIEDGDMDIFWEVLTVWLPEDLVLRFREAPTDEVVRYVQKMISEGMPGFEARERDPTQPVYRSRDDWEDLVADYMHVYGIAAREALDEPWAAFLLFASKISQVTARDQYRYLQAKTIPWIKDREAQERAYRDLIDRGNLPVLDKEAERERKLRMQKKWLKDLDREFEVIRRNPHA